MNTIVVPHNGSIGVYIADKIIDLAEKLKKTDILDEISLTGRSDKDGSSTITLEWNGNDSVIARNVLDFLNDVRSEVIASGKETKEQISPHHNRFYNTNKVIYRFKMWDEIGRYEVFEKELVSE
jgi:exo-beta-1,3-glucanase (GH17 family)